MNLSDEQKEDLRHAIGRALAVRFPAAIGLKAISRIIRKEIDFEFDDADVTAALTLLQGLSLVGPVQDELGKTVYWRASSVAVLKREHGVI